MLKNAYNYRPGVGMVMFNDNKEIFAAQRIDISSPFWRMPQGGIEKNETPEEAVLRELEEEVGTRDVQIIEESPQWFYYDFPEEVKWKGHYQGQRQKWFVLKYLGQDCDINLQTAHPEFSRWRWMSIPKIIDQVILFKKKLYQEIFQTLKPAILSYKI